MPLKQVFKDYTTHLQGFKKVSKGERDQSKSNESFMLEIKLHSFWDEITIQKFETVARVVFLESYKLHVHIRVVDGCTCVSWIVPDLDMHALLLMTNQNRITS